MTPWNDKNRILFFGLAVLALLLGGFGLPQPVSGTLPARIDASRYPHLQAAIDALPDTGGVLQIPPGTYPLTRPLVLTRGEVRIEGSGPATHLVNENIRGEPALLIRPADRGERRTRIWRVEVTGLRITGNPRSGEGVLAEGVNEIYLHGVSVERNGGDGIRLVDCYENPRIVSSSFTYNAKAGLHIQAGHDIVVSANQFEENQTALRCTDSFNLALTGNNLDDHLGDGVVIENTYGSVLSGNMIEECAGWAIVLDRDCYGITVGSNVIAHNRYGVDLRDAWGCAVSANTFTIVAENALRIGPRSGRITVTGNNFSNSYIGEGTRRDVDWQARWPQMSHASGILLEETTDVALVGNVFSGLAGEAVKARGSCRRLVLAGNLVVDPHSPGPSPESFHLRPAREVERIGNLEAR